MNPFAAIDLAKLSPPEVVEALDYEVVLAEMLADLRHRDTQFTALVESDPAYKILEVAAYRETLLRARINDATQAVMLAYAQRSDLDHLAALFGVDRHVIDPGDPDAIPPRPARYEKDDDFRQRIPLSLEGFSTAGPIGAYQSHALDSSGQVKDVSVGSPSPGQVMVTILSRERNGVANAELLDIVRQHLNQEDIRPLTDHVMVQPAEIINYTVDAMLTFHHGPDKSVVAQQAREQANTHVEEHHRLGVDITLSGLYAALHQPGVQNVTLRQPTGDIRVALHQAAYCTELNVSEGGRDE
jgi:phage-related baseplate assembly protein